MKWNNTTAVKDYKITVIVKHLLCLKRISQQYTKTQCKLNNVLSLKYTDCLFQLTFNIPLDTKYVILEMFFPVSLLSKLR